jgi:hypothetical protein
MFGAELKALSLPSLRIAFVYGGVCGYSTHWFSDDGKHCLVPIDFRKSTEIEELLMEKHMKLLDRFAL